MIYNQLYPSGLPYCTHGHGNYGNKTLLLVAIFPFLLPFQARWIFQGMCVLTYFVQDNLSVLTTVGCSMNYLFSCYSLYSQESSPGPKFRSINILSILLLQSPIFVSLECPKENHCLYNSDFFNRYRDIKAFGYLSLGLHCYMSKW